MLLTIYTEDNCCVSASACLYPVRLPSSLECNSCLEWPCHSVALTLTWWSGLILWHTHWQTCRLPIHGSMLSITYTLGFRGQKYSRDKQDTVMFPVDVNLLVSIVNCSPWSKYDNWELPDTWLSQCSLEHLSATQNQCESDHMQATGRLGWPQSNQLVMWGCQFSHILIAAQIYFWNFQ